jgi:MOSC domain-containing protein
MSSGVVGTIARLWRFPVKSMTGEQIEQSQLSSRGLLGDRGYALFDKATGKVVSAKSARLFPNLLSCRAAYVEPPMAGHELPPVRITLANGTTTTSDSGDANRILSEYFRRDISLTRSAPEDFTIDQYHPDIEGLDAEGRRDVVVDQKLGSAYFAEAGIPSPVPVGAFFDLFPVSVLTTSTLERLNEIKPTSRFEDRRFRMNLIVGSNEDGFVENAWIGRELAIGGDVKLMVALADPRCVMTTLPQDDLPADTDILRTLLHNNKVQVADAGQFPCAGVYAVVTAGGTIRIGDQAVLN